MPVQHPLRSTIRRFSGAALSVLLAAALVAGAWRTAVPAAYAAPSEVMRYGGYGISVGPHLESRPDLLNQMGFDWVKVYDTEQIAHYPNHRILFRLEVDGYPPDWDIEAWTRGLPGFAAELARRGVDAVEVGNEPNLSMEWGNQKPDPARYVDALRRVHAAFKQEAPGIVVVSAGLAPTAGLPDGSAVDDLWFAEEMLKLGAANYMDAWAYHPYGFDQPPEADPAEHPFSFRRAELMYGLLEQYGLGKTQVWITEFGWVRDPREEGLDCSNDAVFRNFDWMTVDRQTQAAYTARALEYAATHWDFAGPMFMWNLNWNLYAEDYEPACSHLRWYGFLNRDGTPLPVFYAVQSVPRRPPIEYRPDIGAAVDRMAVTAEAGCASQLQIGSFEVEVQDDSGSPLVRVEPLNAPGRPVVATSRNSAHDGDEVQVTVDATGVEPGLYLIAVTLRAQGSLRDTSTVVRGWLMLHHPSSPECLPGAEG